MAFINEHELYKVKDTIDSLKEADECDVFFEVIRRITRECYYTRARWREYGDASRDKCFMCRYTDGVECSVYKLFEQLRSVDPEDIDVDGLEKYARERIFVE